MFFTLLPAAPLAALPVLPETSPQRTTGTSEQDSQTGSVKPRTAETARTQPPGSAGEAAHQWSRSALKATNNPECRENIGACNRAGRGLAAHRPNCHTQEVQVSRFVYIYPVLHCTSFGELATAQRILVATTSTGHITGANRNIVYGKPRCTAIRYRIQYARDYLTDRVPGLYDTGRLD